MKSKNRERGAALLIILSLVVAAIAVFITSAASVNTLRNKATKASNQSLREAQRALLGYAMIASAPGQLPCPDSDGDGVEDLDGNQCSVRVGYLPFVTLNLQALHDGYNSPLWYSPNHNLIATNALAINSSTSTHLRLDEDPVAFVLVAPGRALDNQERGATATIADYLEGTNADDDTDEFEQGADSEHNDIVAAMDYEQYWSLLEASVLKRAAQLLVDYYTACGYYPWAADFGESPAQSVDSQTQGNIPLDEALPTDWNSGCAVGISPAAWMTEQWVGELYYAMCSSAAGECLSVSGARSGDYSALLIAPGTALGAQARPSVSISSYYESSNADGDDEFILLDVDDFDESFNDLLLPLEP